MVEFKLILTKVLRFTMADESVFEGLNGTQKSAILMMLLGEDEALRF